MLFANYNVIKKIIPVLQIKNNYNHFEILKKIQINIHKPIYFSK